MGKTYKRNSNYRLKKHGKIFTKDQPSWKKHKKQNQNEWKAPEGDLNQESPPTMQNHSK